MGKWTVVAVVVLAAFLAGVWWGGRDQMCVTAQSQMGPVVYCAKGAGPTARLET